MIALLQRVSAARVEVKKSTVGAIERGVLALIGVERGDDHAIARRLLARVLGYRIFPDEQDKMNLSVQDIGGGVLLVPQFTLAADTHKGLRPSFTKAAEPGEAQRLFDYLLDQARAQHPQVQAGSFGAGMQVSLVNDGPVTFWLQVKPNETAQ